jgi:hypothetical protein
MMPPKKNNVLKTIDSIKALDAKEKKQDHLC